MTVLTLAPRPARTHPPTTAPVVVPRLRRRWRLTEPRAVFVLVLGIEVVAALVLVVGFESVVPDSLSRVANAKAVLDSRDPKLAALGFVWSPLPSLLLLPFVPLGHLVPFLVGQGFVINLQSAVAAAGCAVLVRGSLVDLGVGRPLRLALTAAFALHPYLLLYGANGMTEPLLMLWLLLAARSLSRWLAEDRARDLAQVGLALALAYLTRYEAVGAVAAVALVVAVRTGSRARGPWRPRRDAVLLDVLLVAGPAAVAAALFAVTSFVVVGHPFEQLSSQYGNAAQRATAGQAGGQVPDVVAQQSALEPLGWLLVGAAVVCAVVRRRPEVLGVLAPLGGCLAMSAALAATGSTFGWLRFQIYVVPLAVLAAGHVAVACRELVRADGWSRLPTRVAATVAAGVVLVAVAAPPWVSVPPAMQDASLAPEDVTQIGAVLSGDDRREGSMLGWTRTDREVAAYLDARDLADGRVLVDLAVGFAVVTASDHPRQFVITSDRDFAKLLADPHLAPVRYLLVSTSTGYDALTVAHPSLYANGAGLATLVRDFRNPTGGGRDWRLYRVTPRDVPGPDRGHRAR